MLQSRPPPSAQGWRRFGFKPNERGETIDVNEPWQQKDEAHGFLDSANIKRDSEKLRTLME